MPRPPPVTPPFVICTSLPSLKAHETQSWPVDLLLCWVEYKEEGMTHPLEGSRFLGASRKGGSGQPTGVLGKMAAPLSTSLSFILWSQ